MKQECQSIEEVVNDSSSDKNETNTPQQETVMEPKIYNVTSKDDGVTWGMTVPSIHNSFVLNKLLFPFLFMNHRLHKRYNA